MQHPNGVLWLQQELPPIPSLLLFIYLLIYLFIYLLSFNTNHIKIF